jgi:hypothetical protein
MPTKLISRSLLVVAGVVAVAVPMAWAGCGRNRANTGTTCVIANLCGVGGLAFNTIDKLARNFRTVLSQTVTSFAPANDFHKEATPVSKGKHQLSEIQQFHTGQLC